MRLDRFVDSHFISRLEIVLNRDGVLLGGVNPRGLEGYQDVVGLPFHNGTLIRHHVLLSRRK
jgi:hypothetical protein